MEQDDAKPGGGMSASGYSRPPALMFGVPIDNLTIDEMLRATGELVVRGRREHRTHQIATVNADFLSTLSPTTISDRCSST